jgi:hypothetical protein
MRIVVGTAVTALLLRQPALRIQRLRPPARIDRRPLPHAIQAPAVLLVVREEAEDKNAPPAIGVTPAWEVDAVHANRGRKLLWQSIAALRKIMKSALTSRISSTAVTAIFCLVISAAPRSHAQAAGQTTFNSSHEAVTALVSAVRKGDTAELQAILGPNSEQIISSGDEVADKKSGDHFVTGYETKHSLVKTAPHQFTLNIGNNDWPLPIPLVEANDKWYWDGAAGREELLYRRIGHNELSAINVCKGVVSAQRDYASSAHDGQPAGTYAPRLVSNAGKQNGLYWQVAEGENPSPAGPLLAQADAEGYDTSGKRTPYHGYYYRMLKNPGGFGFIAYPAEYRSSGVMTFIVNQSGVIYQKDLGENTADIAQQMTDYKRDSTWTRVK